MISAVLLCICSHAQPRFCLGVDLVSTIRSGGITVTAGCGFSSRWSVTWRAESGICPFSAKEDNEYDEHLGEFEIGREKTQSIRNSSVGFQYWTGSTFEGAYLEAGVRCTQDMRADCCIGAGYCIPICKNLCTIISAGTDILSTLREGKASGTGLSIGVYWTIGKVSQ